VAAVGPEPGSADRQRSPEFAGTYAAIASRRRKNITTIAVARKLLTRARHLLAAAQAVQAASVPGAAGAPADPGEGSQGPKYAWPSGMNRAEGPRSTTWPSSPVPRHMVMAPSRTPAGAPNGRLSDHSASHAGDNHDRP
jgi:hypothetical protein